MPHSPSYKKRHQHSRKNYKREVTRSRSRDYSRKYRHHPHHHHNTRDHARKYNKRKSYDSYSPSSSRSSSRSSDNSSSRSYSRDRSRSASSRPKHKPHQQHKTKRHHYTRSSRNFDKQCYKDYSHHKNYEFKPKHVDEMERESTPNNKASSEDGKDRTKDAGHFKHKPGIWIKDYKVIAHLGDGTFGRVLEVKDRETSKLYAMKVIRAVDRYIDSAKTETEILTYLKKNDPEDKYHIVKLKSAFDFEKNYCMVFEKLGMSLYDFLKKNNYRGFKIDYIRSFTKQILEAVGFMHQVGLTHTDLKPENILLVNDESIPIKERGSSEDSPRLERSSTCSTSQEKVYYLPKDDRVKIIDMGGATYDHEHHSSVINTRQYRAPEVILGCCQWDHQSDVWSIGCIILELFSGELFFETHESYEHLAMIDKAVGPIPYWMSNRADSETRKYFICSEEYFEQNGTYLDWPKSASSEESVQHVKNLKGINDIIPSHFPELIDLLEKMLVIDPNKRIKCWDALEHPFFKKIGKSGL